MSIKKPFSEARSELTDIVNHVAYGQDRYVLTRNGKDVAAIISIDDFELFEQLEDYLDLQTAKQVDKDIKKHGTVNWKQVKKELGL
ncbi:MAG: type II toxin-antitoxin system Phd/YefM family antitoxin [Chlamydiia bacterium]|nr:type II toxin-antitoxin system Phd/YefM family antitoxin [Chlamydiia bacterium]